MRRVILFAATAALVAMGGGCGSSDDPPSPATSGAVVPGQSVPSDSVVKAWPAKWCSIQPGMTHQEAATIMGPATEQYPRGTDTSEQDSWDAGEWHFTAFYSVDHTIRQLDINDIELTAAQKSSLSCETSRTGSESSPDPISSRVWNESEVLKLAGIETKDNGLTYQLVAHPGCTAAVVMTTANGVETYRSAGDTVATNPDGTAGVKVTAAETQTCQRRFTDALEAVR
jgi:hypothetical protein